MLEMQSCDLHFLPPGYVNAQSATFCSGLAHAISNSLWAPL